MTQDDIIEWALEANIGDATIEYYKEELEAFAKLVADVATAKEREACAKLCDELQDVPATEARHCAQDIRARGEA